MRKFWLLTAFLIQATAAQAKLGLPLVDLTISAGPTTAHLAGGIPSIAIWSSTDVTLTGGSLLTVRFPTGWTTVAPTLSSCNCVFTKFGVTWTAWAFTPYEVTITAGILSGNDLTLVLPYSYAPGAFYVRIDDAAGFKNPTTNGLATLALSYWDGSTTTTTQSRPITIGNGLDTIGQINGYVYSNAGSLIYPVPGALIVADTDTTDSFVIALPSLDQGPTVGTYTAKAPGSDRYSTVTGSDGRFKLQVPYNVSTLYHVTALFGTSGTASVSNSTVTAGTLMVNKRTPAGSSANVSVVSPYTTPIAVTLTGFVTPTTY